MAKFLENTASIKKSVQKKKKDNQETVQKKQSPSVSKKTKQVNDRMTQKYGGTTKKSTPKTVSKAKSQAVQTRLQSKYGGEQKTVKRQTASSAQRRTNANNNLNLKQNQIAKSQAEAKERREFKPTASQRITIEDRLNNKYGVNKADEKRVESANRVIRNTGSAAKKGVQDALSGYGQTIADLTERTASNKNGTQALAMKRGIDTNDKTAMRKLQEERDRTVEHAREERARLFDEQEKRQQKFDKQTKGAKGLEKALYGAVESGTGMAVDMVAGLGTQGGALASMGLRTYGSAANQARKEGATDKEAGLYGLAQAGKEVGTELMFPGVGLARKAYGSAAKASLGELATNTLLRNLKGKTADVASAGIKLLGGTAEENLEEIAGWGIDPIIKEYAYGRNVRKRDAENVMRERSDALRSQITNEDDAKAAAAYISSPSFIEDTKREYINSGLNEKDAEEIANRMRDYLSASLTGDTKAMADIEDEVGRKVAGLKKLSIADWDFKELAETVASTTLLTATTGMPGTVTTATKGSAIRDALGSEGTKALAKTAIDFEDEKLSRQGRAIQERLDSGKDITSTQAYELMSGMHEQVRKDTQRVEASRSTAARQMESERLVVPFAEDPRTGEIIRGEVTEQTFRREETSAKKAIEDQKASLTAKEVDTGSRAIANFKTGIFGVDDANALNYSNTAVREAFKAETGINLDSYIVRNRDGSVDIPATNTATKDALFALAADNLIKTAQAETVNWMDNVKGEVVTQITARMGAKGSVALQQALDDVDERDRSRYMMTANATDMLYQAARNMGESWEEVKADAVKMFPNISEDKLQMMYEAGLEDRNIANDKARGRQVKMGESMSQIGEQETATGMVYVDTPNTPKGTMVRTFTEIAQNLGADIHITDAIRDQDGTVIDRANGSYDPKTNSFYLNVDTGIEKNVGYIFMHELTHYLRRYAPEQYQELENLVREKWFGFNPSQMQDAIKEKIEAYKAATNGKQILTEDMALEEIICDAAHEFINDPNFAESVAEEDPTLAQAVLNSIRNALRKLRQIFAKGTIEDETHMNSLFSELGILSEAEEIWLNAYKQAVKNRAMENLDAWEDEAFKDTRLSAKMSDKWENGEKLTHNQFNSWYSAHKLNYGRATDETMDEAIEKIRKDGFISTTAISNVVPASINDYIKPEKRNVTQDKYGARAGDTVMLVPRPYVNLKDDIVKNGFKPREYEIVKVERDFQPYYELYSKAYDEAQAREARFSITPEQQETIVRDISPDIRFSIPTFRDEKAKGKFIASLNSGKGGFAGLSEIASGKTILRRVMEANNFSPAQVNAATGFLEHMADYLESDNIRMKYAFIGWDDISNAEVTVRRDADGNIISVAMSAMVVNGEYPVNFDMTTICNKREGVMEVIQALTQKYDADTGKTILNSVKLTDEKMWSINKALKAEGIDTACLGCFVEARRYYTNRFIDKIDDVWNAQVREARRKLGLPEEEYFNFAKGKKVSGEDYNQISDLWTAYDESSESKRSPSQRIKILMDEIVKNKEVDSPYLKLISAEDILTPEGIRGFKELSTHNKDRDMVKMIKSIYGTSAPKEILAFTPYNSEIALLPDKIKGVPTNEYLKSIGGTRVQSFSDFKMEHFFDHLQMVSEEAARGFVNHGYSKVIAYPRLFGLTGRKINMSVMFDVLPASTWKSVLNCSDEKSVEIARKYQGLRFVKEKPAENKDNRPYKEVTLEGVHGYLTYLVSDADYVNSEFDKLYQENLANGMSEEEAKRKANTDKPFEQSINYSDAVELENKEGYKKNVGIIGVAFGDEHLKMLLDDPNVRYIIPYHRSGLPVFIAQKTALDIARDYTDNQNTNKAKGGYWINSEGSKERMKTKYEKYLAEHSDLKYPAIEFFANEINGKGYTVEFGKKNTKEKGAMAGTADFDVYENLETAKDIREISNAYLEHCIQHNFVPVFHEFAGHPNYYKMLFDFAVTDGTTDHIYPQQPVKNIYPGLNLDEIVASGRTIDDLTDDDFKDFYAEIERGMSEQNAKTELRRTRLGKVLDEDILSQTGENSIIADTNIQHITNGTPDYTSVRYGNDEVTPEVTDADIRYSMPTQDADGNILSDGQMEYFKNSQARDSQGRLVPVYHTTNKGGFTVFDPSKSDDHRSLFFTDDRGMSASYSKQYGIYPQIINPYDETLPIRTTNDVNSLPDFGDLDTSANKVLHDISNIKVTDRQGNVIASGDDFVKVAQDVGRYLESEGYDLLDDFYVDPALLDEGEAWGGDPGDAWNLYNALGNVGLKYTMDYGDPTVTYSCYLNLENPLIIDGNGQEWNAISLDTKLQWQNSSMMQRLTSESHDTREWSEIAYEQGYDGVIFRNIVDYGDDMYGIEPHDVFIAFSSNQVKGTRNLNPTENPDIRYSVTPEDEAKSRMAYADAMDDSYEELERYEKMAAESPNVEQYFGKAYKEEDVSKFYAALRNENGIVFEDPVLEEGRQRVAKTKNELYSNIYAKANDRWTTGGEVLDIDSVKKNVRNLVMGTMANSNTDHQYKQELVDKTLIDMRTAFQLMKQDRTDIASALLYHSAQRMIENVDFIKDDTLFQEYKGIRDYLRREPIYMEEEYWQSKTFLEFQRANMGKLKLRKGNGNVETIYGQLKESWPHIFNEAERSKHGWEDSPEDLLEHIEYVINQNQKPFMEAYSSEEATSLCYEIADNLYDIMAAGEELNTLADTYKKRFDERTKALKARHQEAIAKVRENAEKKLDREKSKNEDLKRQLKTQKLKTDAETRYLKFRNKVDIGMLKAENAKERRAERERRKKEKAQRKENALHKKYMESIQKSHKALTERLRTNTKDKHIPEFYKKQLAALLGAFDFQTLKSKAMETKEGPDGYVRVDPSAKTIKMLELQAVLKAIENQSQLFHVSDSITDIMDNLLGIAPGSYGTRQSIDGKTLDELDASELKDIDRMLKSLIHEFNNYENVRVGMQKQKASTIGGAQIESCLKHAEKFGTGNDYLNFIGAVDQIINLDEMTPAYLFRRIDPTGNGLGIMWKELRRSFDRYVRNQDQLNNWMEEIVGKYHKKGMLWNKYGAGELSDWRSENYAKEFTLSNGQTIKLTIAQMMSIHCLAKRDQAYRHMTGAGIVVKPVTFQAKLMSDLKKKANYALPVSLSHEDLMMIDQNLTPEQIDVADKLQQLMATKMAEWGNEASMNVIGIRLFEDPDYFPIKSDKAALEKDFSAEQFTEMIRSFGFTKAVAPRAKNAIAIDDIFDVVTEHCNNMNLYNSYTESLNDFMKVYNYHQLGPNNSDYSVEQAVAHAYSQKATTFISTFIKDLNGNVSKGRQSGISKLMDQSLGNAKKASVFANGRVALQQPTAIVRAFAEISPKYLVGVNPTKENMKEMFEHCPIALWKSWGYYDINMGKSIEDLMMNNGSWLEDMASDLYGKLDNATWSVIWGMCKNEIKETHKDVKEGSDEFFDLVNERMTEVVDLTQVVDSPFHRSHAMRSKDFLHKMTTAFMAEPTLTFNMVRDGFVRAREAWKEGNKAEARKIFNKTARVFLLQATTVAAAAAIWDAVRGKQPNGGDDDDKNKLQLWYANFIANLKDNVLKPWNNIYYIKDIVSIMEGWDQKNLGLQGFEHLADAYAQLTGTRNVFSKNTWYQNALYGIGYLTGVPYKTLMNDSKSIMNMIGVHPGFLEYTDEKLMALQDSVQDMLGGEASASGILTTLLHKSDESEEVEVKEGSLASKFLGIFGIGADAKDASEEADTDLEDLPDGLTEEQIAEIRKAEKRRSKSKSEVEDGESVDETNRDEQTMLFDATKAAVGYEGEERDKKIWASVSKGYKDHIDDGDFRYIYRMRHIVEELGGDTAYLDEQVMKYTKSAMKKTIISDPTDEQIEAQNKIKGYLLNHGMSEAELSQIAYESDTKNDLKVAFRINDEDAIVNELVTLLRAGISRDDIYKIYDNRNKIDLAKYKDKGGKYADKLKSTGNFVWPTQGTITSHFGYRNAPTAGASSNHPAIDIGAATGTPVVAADGGVVITAGNNGGYGNSVGIKHDNGMVTYYNHLYSWNVKVGDTVAQGQQIAQVGSTGISTGPHLDFKILDTNGKPVDPEKYLPSN